MTYVILALREAARSISHQFGAFLGSVLTVYLAMLTAGSIAVITINTNLTLEKFRSEASLEIYLKSDIDSLTRQEIQDKLVANKYILNIKYINKDMALFRLRETFGQPMVAGLKTNPLPESYEVTLEPSVYDKDNFDRLVDSLNMFPGVEDIGYVPSAIAKLRTIFKVITILGIIMGALVVLATGFIVGNTIHIKIAENRQTFYIMHLIGASRGFIYAPYLMLGSLVGLLGSAFAIVTLKFGAMYFNKYVIPISILDITETISFIIAGSLIGFVGSYIALKKFLDV